VKEWLNENTLFNTVAMFASETSSLVLVVEGDDDYFVLSRHSSSNLAVLAGVGGRENVLRAAGLARERDLGQQVRFLVDKDYDDFLEGDGLNFPNVFVSQAHDFFMDLLIAEESIAHLVIDAHARTQRRGAQKKKRRPAPGADLILRDAMGLAVLLSAVRITNERCGLGLEFDRFAFGSLKESEFTVEAIADIVMTRSSFVGDRAAVQKQSTEVLEEIEVRAHTVVGDHDLFKALARVLKRFEVSVSHENLMNSFLAGVSCVVLAATHCFELIQSWCAENGRVAFDCAAA
jgi:hypothetical protein